MLLRPKTGLKDMVDRARPGQPVGGQGAQGRRHDPGQRRCPTSTSTRSSRRWTRDTRDYLRLLLGGAGRGPARQRPTTSSSDASRASSPPAATSREITRLLAGAARATSAARSTTSSCSPTALGDKDDQLAQLVDSSNAVFRAFAAQDAEPARDARAAARRRCADDPGRARARPTRWRNELGPTLQALRPARARSARRWRQTRPFLRDSDADHPRPAAARSRAPRCRPSQALRPAARDLAALTPDLIDVASGSSTTLLQRARLQPARARARATCSGSPGPTTRAADLLHPGRARPDPPRPVPGLLHVGRRARRSVAKVNPLLGDARSSLLNAGAAVDGVPAARRGAGSGAGDPDAHGCRLRLGRGMQKQAPTVGRLLVMVGFALSCFGLLLFLWLAFGGPIPLKPKGYRSRSRSPRPRSWPRRPTCASPASPSARSRTIDPDADRPHRRRRSSSSRATRRSRRTRKAILRQKTLLGETYVELTPGDRDGRQGARGRHAGRSARCRRRSSSTRSSAPSTRARARRSRPGCRTRRAAIDGRGRDINDALGNLPVRRRHQQLLKILNTQQGAVAAARAQHRRGVRRADRARRPAARR